MMKVVRQSHTDHGLTVRQIVHLINRFKDRDGFFVETITLPDHLGTVNAELYGPLADDPPVDEADVVYVVRGKRPQGSRMVRRPVRKTNRLTVIAGPLGEEPCVLYTAYGGEYAPREPWDPSHTDESRQESVDFWSKHALALQDP